MTCIRVHITGSFLVEGPNGERLTPTGTKDQGLLLLLLTSATGERARLWLQDKLWSDRGREQAAASLRQSLTKIRRSLKEFGDILESDRRSVRLDMQRIEVIMAPHQEFAEGLDVRDQEFEFWLAAERAARAKDDADVPRAPSARPARPYTGATRQPPRRILLFTRLSDDADLTWFGSVIAGNFVNLLGEVFSIPIVQGSTEEQADNAWSVTIETAWQSLDQVGVRVELSDVQTQQLLWVGHRAVPKGNSLPTGHRLILQLAQQLVDAVHTGLVASGVDEPLPDNSDLLATIAIRRLLSGQRDHVAKADELLKRAYDIDPRGTYLAWRAHLREIQFVEGLRHDMDELHSDARDLLDAALDREPNNALVLALAAHGKLYLDLDIPSGLDFAARSVRIQGVNPMGWWALSAARYFMGDLETSAKHAKFAHFLLHRTALCQWADGMLAGMQLAHGVIEDDVQRQTVAAGLRHFRPGLRLLMARHAKSGAWDRALSLSNHLYEIDPGFSVQRIIRDPGYCGKVLDDDSKSA